MKLDMKQLAFSGAKIRLTELDAARKALDQEEHAILTTWPTLDQGHHPQDIRAAVKPLKVRRMRKRHWTSAQRKAKARQMRAYWIAKRKAKRESK